MHLSAHVPELKMKDNKPELEEFIDWLHCNSVIFVKCRHEASHFNLSEREQLLLTIYWLSVQHEIDVKQLYEMYAKNGVMI